MAKPMTEAQLFRRVAQAFANETNLSPFLCDVVWHVCEDRHGYYGAQCDELNAAHARIQAHLTDEDGYIRFSAYVDEADDKWDTDRNPYREARTLAALWMALEAEEEARQLRRAA